MTGILRPVTAMRFPGVSAGPIDQQPPHFEWVDPGSLLIDETYQRNLSERSVSLIRRIIAGWSWTKFKPPVVVQLLDGIHVIDGQHTAIAALSHPGITRIPVMIVDAPTVADRASAFIGQNRDRIHVTVNQIHFAASAAGDDEAVMVNQVCTRAGVKILRQPPGPSGYKPGDTMSVSTIRGLISRRGALLARQILQALAEAKLAPISAALIKAVEELHCVERHDLGDLAIAIRGDRLGIETQAKMYSIRKAVPVWRGLVHAIVYEVSRNGNERGS